MWKKLMKYLWVEYVRGSVRVLLMLLYEKLVFASFLFVLRELPQKLEQKVWELGWNFLPSIILASFPAAGGDVITSTDGEISILNKHKWGKQRGRRKAIE